MQTINLVMADKDEDFLSKISKYIIDKNLGFDVAVFTEQEALFDYLEEETVNILLIDESFCARELIDKAKSEFIIILTIKNDLIFPGYHSIKKFQKSENFLKSVIDIYTGHEVEEEEDDISEEIDSKVIGFYSPTGGSGNTSISLAFATNATLSGNQSFYINLERFNSSSVFFLSEKIILPEDIEDIINNKDFQNYEKISIISDKDVRTGVNFFPFSFNDQRNFNYLKPLINIIKNSNIFKYIVIDASRDNYFSEEIVEICDKLFVTVNEATFSHKKTTLFLHSLVNDKTHLILNKKDLIRPEDKTIEDLFEYICEIPYISLASQIKDLEVFSSKFERYTSQIKSIL